MWVGVSLQKNGLGRLCLIAAFFLIWTLVRRWQGHNTPVWKYQTHAEVFVLAMTIWLMRGPGGVAYSATAISALAAGLIGYFAILFLKKSGIILGAGTLITIVSIIIIFAIVAVFFGGSSVGSFASTVGRDATLTGRTDIWAALLQVVRQRPLFGSGYGGFWTSKTLEIFKVGEAHSGYLDVLLGLGFSGILLFSAFLYSSCRKAQKALSLDFDWGTLWICFLIMTVVHNVTESSIYIFASQLTAIILFFSVSSPSVLSGSQQA
jgi:O-antigen ligase